MQRIPSFKSCKSFRGCIPDKFKCFINETFRNDLLIIPESQNVKSENVQYLIDIAFTDNSTLGVVVIKNGRIIGEKYAPGFDLNSHGTSWSMAKSYYAALIGISIDKGEIGSLDERVKDYLDYFNDERSEITIRDLLDMSSGLDFPSHEHEKMFFQKNHLDYAKKVGVEKDAGIKFEYNNVNSMLIGDILFQATGKKADVLFEERILQPLQIIDYKLWKDEKGNVMTLLPDSITPFSINFLPTLIALSTPTHFR